MNNHFPFLSWLSAIILISLVLFSTGVCTVSAENQSYFIGQISDNGNLIDQYITGPGLPPSGWVKDMNAVNASDPSITVLKTGEVPALRWSYGCSATSASMYFGYFDRNGYPNLYVGSTDGGVFPLTNKVWGNSSEGYGECPLSASHKGIDNLTIKGHVDDYYSAYDSAVDPYYGSWAEHSAKNCVGDYMGTNQYQNWLNTDGSTVFFYYTNGSPLYDYSGSESDKYRDGTHGMRLFAESRGYSVATNYNQYIFGYKGNTKGFTYSQYKSEIDSGYPVLIQVEGHTMIGVGYTGTDQIIVHDTWDYSSHTMTWGGKYSGMQHFAVSVFHMKPVSPTPTPTVSPTPTTTVTPTPTVTVTPTPVPETGNLSISSSPSKAAVWLDETSTGHNTPVTINKISAGNHSLKLTKSGYVDYYQNITIKSNETSSVAAVLTQAGSLTVSSKPTGASIWVDGTDMGRVTKANIDSLSTGNHELKLVLSGYADYTSIVTVRGGQSFPVYAILTQTGGSISITSNPSGAGIFVDNTDTGYQSPYTVSGLSSGWHTVLLKKDGYKDWSKTVMVNSHMTTPVSASLIPGGTNGSIFIYSNPSGASISIDGVSTGSVTSKTITGISSGEHTVTLSKAGYANWSQDALVKAGVTTTVFGKLSPVS